MDYEDLLVKAEAADLIVKEKDLHAHDGRIIRNRIAIRKSIPTTREKACVLAEELGHHYTSVGDILDQNEVANRKQEYRARLYGYNLQIGLSGLVAAFQDGCRDLHEIAEYLNVTDAYLDEAIECYREKFGIYACLDNYIIYFIPNLAVAQITDFK